MIKNTFNNFRRWCNSNAGLLGFLAIIIMVIGLIPSNKIDFGFANTIFNKIKIILIYNVKVPVYIFSIILIVGLIYLNRFRRKYKQQKISIDFLEGNWKNEWTVNGQVGSEMCQIKNNGKYCVNGEHWFTLEEFKYDYKKNKIEFGKSSIRSVDDRKMLNILTIENNDLLIGTENNYDIKYRGI
jgi:hypothetical protein